MWLDCFLGTITEEISDALVSHVVQKDGIWCLDITVKGRTTIVDGVKQTGNLRRSVLDCCRYTQRSLRAGFLDRVDHVRRTYGESAPLFPASSGGSTRISLAEASRREEM
jgi:hypothetical protein